MDALGNGGSFWWNFSPRGHRHRSTRKPKSSSSESIDVQGRGWSLADFPLKQAGIAASLTLTGDTIAQVRDRWIAYRRGEPDSENKASPITSPHPIHTFLNPGKPSSSCTIYIIECAFIYFPSTSNSEKIWLGERHTSEI